MSDDDLNPPNYRVTIRPDLGYGVTHPRSSPHQKVPSRKRRKRSSSEEYESEGLLPQSILKKPRVVEWTEDAKTAMLHCRLHLSHVFDENNEAVAKRAWAKIAAMMDILCTGDDCAEMFESLIKEYLRKQKDDFKGVDFESDKWEQYQTLEKLFMTSPQLVERYESAECSPTPGNRDFTDSEDLSDAESSFLSKAFLADHPFLECFKKFCDRVRQSRQRKMLLEKKITTIMVDLLRIRSENMMLMSEFLKRILFSFSELDELARRESLEALTSIFPSLFCVSSVIITAVQNYLISSTFSHEEAESNIVLLMSCHRSTFSMLDTSDEEDALYVKFIPFHEQYHMKKLSNQSIAAQSSLSEFNFKGHLHVSRSTMEALISQIAPIKIKSLNPLRVPISIERQMVVFMWYLTHNETCEQLALRFCVLWSEVIVIIRHLIVLITENLFLIQWPSTPQLRTEAIKAFETIREDSFPGVIGALGTKYLPVTFPAWFKDPSGKIIRNGKVHQPVAVQAVADANFVFTSVHVVWPELPEVAPGVLKPMPSEETKTITRYKPAEIFSKSPFHFTYCRGTGRTSSGMASYLPDDVHVVADSTFPLIMSVMTPYDKTIDESPSQYLYDQQLHRSRSAVELAFGKLLNRFNRLNFLDHTILLTEGFIKACAGIHNFCLKNDDDFDPIDCELPEKHIEGIAAPDKCGLVKRDKICDEIYKSKICYVARENAPPPENTTDQPEADPAIQMLLKTLSE